MDTLVQPMAFWQVSEPLRNDSECVMGKSQDLMQALSGLLAAFFLSRLVSCRSLQLLE